MFSFCYRFFFLLTLTLPLWAAPPSSEKSTPDTRHKDVSIDKINAYLNGITTLKASFTQKNPDGSHQKGLFFLQRPGKMRLKYAAPAEHLIISDGTFLIFHNPDLDESTHVPLDQTPAEFLVKENVDLTRDAQILDLQTGEQNVRLTLVRREDPDSGTLILVFHAHPFSLKEWIIQDQNGSITHVFLDHLEKGVSLPDVLFVLPRF